MRRERTDRVFSAVVWPALFLAIGLMIACSTLPSIRAPEESPVVVGVPEVGAFADAIGVPEEQRGEFALVLQSAIQGALERAWDEQARPRLEGREPAVTLEQTAVAAAFALISAVLTWIGRNRTRGDALTRTAKVAEGPTPTPELDASGRPRG